MQVSVVCSERMPGPGYEADITTVFPREKPGLLGVQVSSSIPVLTGKRKMEKREMFI